MRVVARELLVAYVLLVAFLFAGRPLLEVLGISEPALTIAPPPAAFMCGYAARAARKTPVTRTGLDALTCRMNSKAPSEKCFPSQASKIFFMIKGLANEVSLTTFQYL